MDAKEYIASKGLMDDQIVETDFDFVDTRKEYQQYNLEDLLNEYHEAKVKNLGLFDVVGSLRTCPTSACGGILINKICNNCGVKW